MIGVLVMNAILEESHLHELTSMFGRVLYDGGLVMDA